jgi:hypothetical protein
MAVPIPQLCSTVGPPTKYSSLLGLDSFSDPFSLHQFFPLHFTSVFFSFTSVSAVVLFLSFPFLYYLLIFLFLLFTLSFVSCYFILIPFLPFLYYSDTSPSVPLPWLSTKRLHPPSDFQCFWIVLIPFLPWIFPCPSVHIIVLLGLLALHVVILPWSNIGLQHLPPPLFCFILLLITICYTHFYLFFVLVF